MHTLHGRRPHPPLRRVWRGLVVVALIAVLPCAGLAESEPWWEDAAVQTRDEFNAVKDAVDQTVGWIDSAKQGLDSFGAFVASNLSGPERDTVMAQLRGAQDALDTHGQPLRLASGRLGQVTSVVDGAFELKALGEAARARRGGELASAMHVIGEAMRRYGQDVPAVGDLITFYGDAIGTILDATDAIADAVETNRNQGMVGAGTYLGIENPLYQALVREFGRDFADGHIFEPAGVPYLYQSIDNDQRHFTLIWDPASERWERVDRSPSAMARLYRSYVLARGHPTPQVLRTLGGPSFDPARERLQAGNEAVAMWAGMFRDYDLAFTNVNIASDYELLDLLRDPDAFAARFAHDQAFNLRVQAWMDDIYREALRLDPDDPTARAISAWADRFGVTLPSASVAEQPDLEAPDGEEVDRDADHDEDPDHTDRDHTDPDDAPRDDPRAVVEPDPVPPGAIRHSVVILFDASGSMRHHDRIGMAKRAARNVLTQVTPDTEVALIVFYDCHDLRVEQPFTSDVASVLAQVEAIQPRGGTPLAAGITLARQYIADHARGAARLVVLSDGMETCGGDPVEAARQ